jgi:hypothetical protein
MYVCTWGDALPHVLREKPWYAKNFSKSDLHDWYFPLSVERSGCAGSELSESAIVMAPRVR